ncbi:MAG: class I SAM-dependent methyltransferase [Rivularia sp. (in: Bacteria)]|nr:class I SAM-dependent methyltransferase [Rivularia sp. MS3]
MSADWEKDYPALENFLEKDLDENSSLKKMLRLIGEQKRVVDFGCATGYFARLLNNRGCEVVGVEINSKAAKVARNYCEEVIIADLDFVSLDEIFSDKIAVEKFDVAVFGDILEHLRNPWQVLEETRKLLTPQGFVIASIPNIAHGAIRLALLQGNFEYKALGILDNTHLRFFTRKTVAQLFEESGYLVDVIEPTKLPIYANSDLIPIIDKNNFDINITNEIERDEDADTLQFVIRGYPVSLENKYSKLYKQYFEVVEELNNYRTQLDNLKVELHQSKSQLQVRNTEFEQNLTDLEQSQAQLQEEQNQLQQTQIQYQQLKNQLKKNRRKLEEAQNQFQQTQMQLEQQDLQLQQVQQHWQDNQIKLQEAHAAWEHCQQIIQAMETSKFWKLRTAWLNFKHYLFSKFEN